MGRACVCVCVCVPSEHTQADDSRAVPWVTSPPGHSSTVPLLTGTLQWVSRLDPGVAVRPGRLQGHRLQAQVKLAGGESEAPGRVRKSSGEGPLSWESPGRRLWRPWACTPPWAVSLPPGGATGLTVPCPAPPTSSPNPPAPCACWATQLNAPIYGHSRKRWLQEAQLSGVLWIPTTQCGVAAPWSLRPSPGGHGQKGRNTRWPQGTFSTEGHCGVTVPLVSGGRSSKEAGRGLPAAVSLSLLPPHRGSCLPSFHPSFPPSSIRPQLILLPCVW